MWLGVISDTRGSLDRRVLDAFEYVDFILHCGNIGDPAVLDALSHRAPVSGVLGASDKAEDYDGVLQSTLFRTWFDVGVMVFDRLGDPLDLPLKARQVIQQSAPDLVLFGDPGKSCNTRVDGRLFFNPGSATRRRGGPPPTVGLIEVDGRTIRGEILSLDASKD